MGADAQVIEEIRKVIIEVSRMDQGLAHDLQGVKESDKPSTSYHQLRFVLIHQLFRILYTCV